MSVGLESLTARFEVQVLGEELFDLLRRIPKQYVAFYIPFFPPLGIEPQSNGLTAPRYDRIVIMD
jgi:hypothetical protein